MSLEGLPLSFSFAFGDTQKKPLLHKTVAPDLEERVLAYASQRISSLKSKFFAMWHKFQTLKKCIWHIQCKEKNFLNATFPVRTTMRLMLLKSPSPRPVCISLHFPQDNQSLELCVYNSLAFTLSNGCVCTPKRTIFQCDCVKSKRLYTNGSRCAHSCATCFPQSVLSWFGRIHMVIAISFACESPGAEAPGFSRVYLQQPCGWVTKKDTLQDNAKLSSKVLIPSCYPTQHLRQSWHFRVF